MLPGPIFWVDLVTSSRRARYFVIRILYALVIFLFLWTSYETAFERAGSVSIQTAQGFASTFFEIFATVQLFAIAFVAPAVTAGTIAEERDRRTIEYLFATDLTNAEIVLGKLASRLLHTAAFLLVALPILALAQLFGGIGTEMMIRAFVIALATLVAVASLSMAVSVWTRRGRDAILRVYVILVALWTLPILAQAIAFGNPAVYAWIQPINQVFVESNPFYLLFERLVGGGGGWPVVLGLLRNLGIFSAVCVAAAVWGVRRVHLRAAGAGRQRRPATRWQIWRRAIGNRPMLWKEIFTEKAGLGLGVLGRIAVLLCVAALLVPTVLAFIDAYGRGPAASFYREFAVAVGTIAACGILLLLAVRASTSVSVERERQCWDTLLTTRLGSAEIVLAKILGNIHAVRMLFLVLVVIWGLAAVLDPAQLTNVPVLGLTLAVLVGFFASLGVFFSLWCRSSTRAMAATLAVSLFLGGGYFLCCAPALVGMRGEPGAIVFAPCIPFLLAFSGAQSPNSGWSRDDWQAAYIVGMCLYLLGALGIIGGMIGNFDSLAGRISLYRPTLPPVGARTTRPPGTAATTSTAPDDPAAQTDRKKAPGEQETT